MKKMSIYLTALILLSSSAAYADGAATWVPEDPDPGDTLTITYDASIGTIPETTEQLKIHWGVNEKGHGNWRQPPPEMWPPESVGWTDNKAVQSPMTKIGDTLWEITIMTVDTINTIHFVFTNGTSWDNNSNLNWIIYLGGGGPGPVEHSDNVEVDVLVDLGWAILNRGFTPGDTVECRLGYLNTASKVDTIPLQRQGISNYYRGTGDVVTTIGDTLDYSYYAIQQGKDNWEVYYNFAYYDPTQSEAQRRQIPVTGNSISISDTTFSNTDPHHAPFFRNTQVIAQDVLVTLTCDVRPAYYHLLLGGAPLDDIQSNVVVSHPDSVLAWGVAANGPITGSWSNSEGPDWGPHLMTLANKVMYDDGTHGDAVADDSIYTAQFQFYKDSLDIVGQEFKFGIGGGDNEGGFGNNHVENIDDFQSTATISAQFGSIDPLFFEEWDYDKRTLSPVEDMRNPLPRKASLSQNFPNPFNPITTIEYTLVKPENVSLTIYNILGKQVNAFVFQKQPAGKHAIHWNGLDELGRPVPTGLYFYQIKAGAFTQTRKMLLMK